MSKRFNQYSLKSMSNSIKDLDLEKREVAIYLSVFDKIDSDGDMIKKGAFKKSIKERGVESSSNRQIAFLRHHDWQHQIGKFNKLEEDDKGLFAVGILGTSTKGEDSLRDYDEGIITEHSIGFQYMSDKMKFIEEDEHGKNYFAINELKLWEGSAVTFGANEYANTVDVAKSIEHRQNEVEKIAEQIHTVTKSLLNGKGSDERGYELEMKLKYLNARLVDIANTEPTVKSHLVITETKKAFDWSKANKLLIKG